MSRLIDTQLDGNGDIILSRNDVEIARVDGSGNVATKGTVNGGSSPAIKYLPSGWNNNFLTALHGAGSGQARIALVGDSITQGYDSSDLDLKGWASLLRIALQAQYGDGGSGFKGSTAQADWATTAGVAAGSRTRYGAGHGYIPTLGTWARFGPTQAGPGLSECIDTTDAVTPGSITFTVRGTTVKIFTICNGGANATWQYKIDGGTAVNVTDAAGHNIQVTTVTGLAAGNHTVQVIYTDAGTKTLNVVGCAGENATGVVVNNHGVYGRFASTAVQTPAFSDLSIHADWTGGFKYPADLAIWLMGANDPGQSTTGDAYAKSLRQWMAEIRDGGTNTGTTDIAVILPHIGKNDTTNFLYQDYAVRARGVCEAFGAALFDFWGDARNSWNKWNGLSYWGNAADPTISGTDNIHPSDAGHAYMAGVVQSFITTVAP